MGQQDLTDRQNAGWQLKRREVYSLTFLFICGMICLGLHSLAKQGECLLMAGTMEREGCEKSGGEETNLARPFVACESKGCLCDKQ